MESIRDISSEYICTGCGVCAGICPANAITMIRQDIFRPVVDPALCTKCGRCLSVCPGVEDWTSTVARQLWCGEVWSQAIGRYLGTYVGYSLNAEQRFDSASGGIVTSMLLWMLKTGRVDTCVVSRFRAGKAPMAESILARTPEEVVSAQGSLYCPTAPGAVLRDIKKLPEDSKVVFVGLPCQIAGLRKAEMLDHGLRQKIVLRIGLFCAHMSTFQATNHVLSRFALGVRNVETLRYRGGGWPGGIRCVYKGGEAYEIPLDSYYPGLWAPYFFTPLRCLACADATAEIADISCGDAWLPAIRASDSQGTSIIVTRTGIGEETARLAERDRVVNLSRCSKEDVIQSQRGVLRRKKDGVSSRLGFLNVTHKPAPQPTERPLSVLVPVAKASVVYFCASLTRSRLGRAILRLVPMRVLSGVVRSLVFRCAEAPWM